MEGGKERLAREVVWDATRLGKTNLLLRMAVCLATEEDLLGLKVKKSRVAYYSLELTEGEIKPRLLKLVQHFPGGENGMLRLGANIVSCPLLAAVARYFVTWFHLHQNRHSLRTMGLDRGAPWVEGTPGRWVQW